ncbi:prepilin-type N-terminal cleavage/methylation domain-containing protein [Rhodanobacter sp. BL-MT-08]
MTGRPSTRPHRAQSRFKLHGLFGVSGFTLIELMIALLLGAIVIGGVVSVFLATQQTYRTNQALGDVQDGSRIAFDLMSRDIRDAGLTGCYSNGGSVANVLKNGPNGSSTQDWWANWSNAIHGYSSADPGAGSSTVLQATGADQTQSIELIGAADTSVSVASHTPASSTFTLNETTSTLANGDVIMVCDPNHAVIAQITSNVTGTPLSFQTAASGANPGNCSAGLAFPTVCTAAGTSYTYAANSPIAKLTVADWFIGKSPNSTVGTSLFRSDLETSGGKAMMVAEEMVPNVTSLKFLYHQAPNASFVDASLVSNWAAVDSVQVTMTVQSSNQRASTTQTAISRTFSATSTLRNRLN